MTYIGQQPATTFDSGIQDRFTGLTTNTVTLNHEISAEEDILVVWNNIVQDKNTYSVGGTGNKTVTLGGTLVSADVVTVYYLNKVMQSINPTAGSVTSTTITDDIISGQTALGATPADTDELLVSDAGVLKRVDYSYLKGGDNTPAFMAVMGSDDSLPNSVFTKATFDTEVFDTDSAFASNKFTVPSGEGGKYLFVSHILCYDIDDTNRVEGRIYKNGANSGGASTGSQTVRWYSGGANFQMDMTFTTILDLSATDYIELYVMQTNGDTQTLYRDTWFAGYKLNGV